MVRVNLHELKARLSEYARQVKAGGTVIVCERNIPIGEFRPLAPAKSGHRPKPGAFRDQIRVGRDFFAADERIERDFLVAEGPEGME